MTSKRENYILQAISFDKTKYSESRAKQWIRLNDYKGNVATADDSYYYFEQQKPDSLIDPKIKPIGKTGISFVVMKPRDRMEGGKRSIFEQQINERCLYCL